MNTTDYGNTLESHEREVVQAIVHAMGIDELHLLTNGDVRARTLFPLTGYVAAMFENAPFCRDAFCHEAMFKGMARCRVMRRRADGELVEDDDISDVEKAGMRRGLNTLIRDVSPDPPGRDSSESGGWVCSLGTAGWVGLYSKNVTSRGIARAASSSVELWLICVAGLDPVTSDAMLAEMPKWTGTMSEVFAPCGDVANSARGPADHYRRLARHNRMRLLAQALQAMDLIVYPSDERLAEAEAPYRRRRDDEDPPFDAAVAREALEWTGLKSVPAWYVLPTITPRDCPPLTLPGYPLGKALAASPQLERAPKYVSSARDVMFYDVLSLGGGKLAIYAGCASTKSACGVPQLLGPVGQIDVSNPDNDAQWTNDKFCAFPSEAKYVPGGPTVVATRITWESPEVVSNRQIQARYMLETPAIGRAERLPSMRYGAGYDAGGQATFHPKIVRCSATDVFGMAWAPVKTAGRLAGLCVDERPYQGVSQLS